MLLDATATEPFTAASLPTPLPRARKPRSKTAAKTPARAKSSSAQDVTTPSVMEALAGTTEAKATEAPAQNMKVKHFFEDGVWVERLVPAYQPDAVDMITDPRAILLGDISLQWESLGRSAMAWAWVHRDSKYSHLERSRGYGRVDPNKVPITGYTVQDVPGTGKCYVLQDVVLMEIPKAIADKHRALLEKEVRDAQIERKGLTANKDREIEREHGDLVRISRGLDEDMQTFGNPIAQEQAALARSLKAMQDIGGNPRLGQDLRF